MRRGKCFNNFGLLIPRQGRKLPLFIDFKNIFFVGLKQHPCRYWISSVFVLSILIMACVIYKIGFLIGMSYSPYNLFQCPFNIKFESLRIVISFFSKMTMQPLSHN